MAVINELIITRLRQGIAVVLILISGTAILTAGLIVIKFRIPETVVFFKNADKIYKSVYAGNGFQKTLDQNFKIQKAIFLVQKKGIELMIYQQHNIQTLLNRVWLTTMSYWEVLFFLLYLLC